MAGIEGTDRAIVDDAPIRALLIAGNTAHKWHNWEKTTPAIVAALKRDVRMRVEVSNDFEDLARKDLNNFDVIVQNNYANWQDPRALSDSAKTKFMSFLGEGKGLVVIHFANGAFHFSLPNAGESDWPEYRRIVRRVWNHHGSDDTKSGHDAFGTFEVATTSIESPITQGLNAFRVNDELYFRQHGDEPIEPLLSAKSKVTGREEPLAWTYQYGKARVFQTLLGHSEKTYDVFEPREMLRRAVAWCANREVRKLVPSDDPIPADIGGNATAPARNGPLIDGRFGKGLDARVRSVEISGRPEFRRLPLTIELHAKLFSKGGYNILVASDTKASADHWEIFTDAGSGELSLYAPGHRPDHVRTGIAICDSQWHHIVLSFEESRARFVIDGKPTSEVALERVRTDGKPGNLAIGALVERGFGCDGVIDDVRISSGIVQKSNASKPAEAEPETLGLWSFDELHDGKLADKSSHKNAGRLIDPAAPALPPQAFVPPDGLNCDAAEPERKVTLIDRSVNDVFMAVKADGAGRLFVGGRESLFVFEPNPKGGFLPKRELFRFPQDSIIIGVEYRGDDLYVLTDNALYLITNGRTRRENLKPRRLLWGLPLDLHVSFHCLAWGPEGDLYLNHGDPLLNYGDFNRPDHWGHWTLFSADGSKTPYTGVGSVLRIRPDGSNLRVVATGFRGPVGLVFDRQGNLFTNDNDHESMADRYAPARLIHAAPHSDFAWPRGWMASMSPDRSDLLEPLNVSLSRGVPCDMAFYDDPEFPQNERDSLLLCRWDRFDVARYVLKRRGASFTAEERPFLKGRSNARPVGVAVDALGRVFVTMLYLSGNVATPHCYSDLVMVARDGVSKAEASVVETSAANSEVLWKELSSVRKERRVRAEIEIRRRGTAERGSAFQKLKQTPPNDPAFPHLLWLSVSNADAQAVRHVASLTRSENPEVRLQAVRALAETSSPALGDAVLTHALDDEDRQVRLAAVTAFYTEERTFPFDRLVNAASVDDDYLRQVTTRLLARRAELNQLETLISSTRESDRLIGVLAAGIRLTVPGNHFVPPADLPLSYPAENAFFKLNQRFADSETSIDLKTIGRIGSFTTGELWKFAPPSESQKRLVELLRSALADPSSQVGLQARYWLSLLRDPQLEPVLERSRLTRIASGLSDATPVAVSEAWWIGPFTDSDADNLQPHPPEQNAIDLTATYRNGDAERGWTLVKASNGQFPLPAPGEAASRNSSYAHFRVQSSARQHALICVGVPQRVLAWSNGRQITDRLTIDDNVSEKDFIVELQPGSNDLLLRFLGSSDAEHARVRILSRQPIVLRLPDKLDSATLAMRLREAQGTNVGAVAAEFATLDWPAQISRGDLERGRKLFGTLGCAKCHAIAANQKGGGGPSLAEARKRFTVAHVVESILLPSRQVADPFLATTIVEESGVVNTGLVVAETADQLELLLPDATRRTIKLADIEERKTSNLSPMPQGLMKTTDELRDLAAYLLSENPSPP
ncbi:MAG: ThuA domain-containing protein [Planctomycetaceae bacterium]